MNVPLIHPGVWDILVLIHQGTGRVIVPKAALSNTSPTTLERVKVSTAWFKLAFHYIPKQNNMK